MDEFLDGIDQAIGAIMSPTPDSTAERRSSSEIETEESEPESDQIFVCFQL